MPTLIRDATSIYYELHGPAASDRKLLVLLPSNTALPDVAPYLFGKHCQLAAHFHIAAADYRGSGMLDLPLPLGLR